MPSGLPYWIEEFNGNFYIWTKIPNIPANSSKQILIKKEPGYSPDPENVFLFFDHFDDVNLIKWDDSLARGSYVVEDSLLKMYNDWGGCCNASCYYNGLATKDEFTRPFTVDILFRQNPYTSSSNCGRTGPSIEHLNQMEVIPSTSTGSDGLNMRIGGEYVQLNYEFPSGWNKLTVKFDSGKILAKGSWMADWVSFVPSSEPSNIIDPICIAGDTDDTNIKDEVDYFIVRKFAEQELTYTIEQITTNIWKVTINNPNSVDLTDFQVQIPANSIVSSNTESLNISDVITKILFGTSDGKLWKWDGSNWVYVDDKSTIDEATFFNEGMDNPVKLDKATILLLTPTPEIVSYTNETINRSTLNVTFIPYKQLAVPNELQSLYGYSELTVNVVQANTSGVIKLAVTRDLNTYYAWDGSSWQILTNSGLDYNNSSDVDNVINNGMTPETVNSLTWTEWSQIFPDGIDNIAFAVAIQYNDINDDKSLDKIEIQLTLAEPMWLIDTHNHDVKQNTTTILIEFSEPGRYKINYLD